MAQYTVEFLPLASRSFKPALSEDSKADPNEMVLLSCPVEIATLHNPEFPQPVPFNEPSNFIQGSSTPHRGRHDWSVQSDHAIFL
ncbi:hypothetical protein GALMADRAFT_236994 [Galerina marginata CBS 339.88]|uniref:Uncharacterized protein n=1 Tax=Galerina marginata (strain CBS 339.88) TaxID=685588 RepID=A0A067TM14_GALM3|nr:hypothetical protein GALMADRAFT_236994 [Galerina marginata CBS 339.88]